jgi:hypothetical protein
MTHKKILLFIESIRNSFPDAVKVYTQGSCFKFYLILKSVIPNAVPYYDHQHVITRVGKYFYDITGVVFDHAEHYPLTDTYIIKRLSRCVYKS